MMKGIKGFLFIWLVGVIAVLIACGDIDYVEPFNEDDQLETDIGLIEDYLAELGITDYDTLDTETRIYVEETGDGGSVDYEDIAFFDYVGKELDGRIFDTSIADTAYWEDFENLVTYYEVVDTLTGEPIYDVNGFQDLDSTEFVDNYSPIYSSTRLYEEWITTHTPGGWAMDQQGAISGFSDGVHYAFENVNIGGKIVVIMPSVEAYGNASFNGLANTVLRFDIYVRRTK